MSDMHDRRSGSPMKQHERVELNRKRLTADTYQMAFLLKDAGMQVEDVVDAAMLLAATIHRIAGCGHEDCFARLAKLSYKRAEHLNLDIVEPPKDLIQ